MIQTDAREILGLGPDEDPRPNLAQLNFTREKIAEMVRTAPNDALAERYQEGLLEFDRALAAIHEFLDAPGPPLPPPTPLEPSTPPPAAPAPAPPAEDEPSVKTPQPAPSPDLPPTAKRGPRRAFLFVSILLILAAGTTWFHLKREEDRRLMLQAELARLEGTGAAFIENRSWPEAVEVFQRVEKLSPGSEIAAIGRRSIESGMAEEESQFIGYWSGQARASFEAGLLDDAETAARKVLAKFPTEAESLAILEKVNAARSSEILRNRLAEAHTQFDDRRWDDAIRLAEAILRDHPDEQTATTLIADARDAIRMAEANASKARELLAMARERDQGVFDQQALDWLREAASLAPTDPDITAVLEKMASYSRTLRVPGDFPTPIEAIAEARNKDRILIAEGTWLGPITINAPIEIQGAGPAKTIIQCPADSGSALSFGPGAKGARVSGINLRHDSFEAASERFSVVLVRGGAVTFVDCHFSDASGNGLTVIEAGHVIASRCRFSGNGWNGIAATGPGSLLEVRDSESLGNFEHGIESWDGAAVILTNNRCENNSRNGIHADNGNASARIENNRLLENREFGLVIGSAAAGNISGNTARGNLLGGIVIRTKAAGVSVATNEILRNQGPGLILERGLPAAAYANNKLSANTGKPILDNTDFDPGPEVQATPPQAAGAGPGIIDPQ